MGIYWNPNVTLFLPPFQWSERKKPSELNPFSFSSSGFGPQSSGLGEKGAARHCGSAFRVAACGFPGERGELKKPPRIPLAAPRPVGTKAIGGVNLPSNPGVAVGFAGCHSSGVLAAPRSETQRGRRSCFCVATTWPSERPRKGPHSGCRVLPSPNSANNTDNLADMELSRQSGRARVFDIPGPYLSLVLPVTPPSRFIQDWPRRRRKGQRGTLYWKRRYPPALNVLNRELPPVGSRHEASGGVWELTTFEYA